MKHGTSNIVSMRLLMRNAEPVSPTREVRRRLVAHDCMTNNDSLEVPSLHPYVYIKDHLGSVRLTVDAIANNNGTGNASQSMEYLPSGAIFRSTNYAFQPRRFCEKELVMMHGWNMYDSQARYQYSLMPRFSTMDPLAEWDFATSPYAYCQNDFVNLVDPWGLEGWPGRMNYIEEAVVWGHRRGTIAGDIYGAEFSLWCDNVNRYRNPLPGEFATYQTYVDRYDPNLYGGGGGFSREDWETVTKIWEAENTGVSSIASVLDNNTLKVAELSYLINEKINNSPIASDFIDWHASNIKYIKVAGKASFVMGIVLAAYDVYNGYLKDGKTIGYNTVRNLTTGGASIIGGKYGGIYGAKWGAAGNIPGIVVGGIAGSIVGSLGAEYVSGLVFDELYGLYK